MLTTIGALVILLGLMVSLARWVRHTSAVDLTKTLLRRLDGLMVQYQAHHNKLPNVMPFIDAGNPDPDEKTLQKIAMENNRQVLAALRSDDATKISPDAFNGLPYAVYDLTTLRDAWGTPIVFMPAMHPAIGMAPQNRWFFFSAGPDRRFLTQEDNLYSYEESSGQAE
jgi:hypothetical protein